MFYEALFICLFLTIVVIQGGATDPSVNYREENINRHQFEEEKWEKTIEGIDYAQGRQDAKETTEENSGQKPQRKESSKFWVGFFKVFLIISGIGIVALLLVHFIGPGAALFKPKSRKLPSKTGEINLDEIEENILETDLEKYLRLALEQQRYSHALRLYYLAIIKELSLSQLIKWKREKTNKDYLRELQNSDLHENFGTLTNVFERIWYGNREISLTDFEQLKPGFEKLLTAAKVQLIK